MRRTARVNAPVCRTCGARLTAQQNFCGQCGTAVRAGQTDVPAHLQQRIQNAQTALEAERKFVTVLFADVAGSTALIDELDPEQAASVLDPVLQAMVSAVHDHGGIVTRIQGDGIMALFGAPLAQEDHAARACRAALDMRALPEDPRIAVRVGLHSGEVAVRIVRHAGFVEYDSVGVNVHLAARMEQSARPGSVRITAATQRLVAHQFAFLPLGGVAVKRGAGRDVEAFELLGSLDWRGRWHARGADAAGSFINRKAEFAQLEQAAGSVASGTARIVAVVGHAGTGKSRLVHEFAARLARAGWQVLEAPAGDEERSSSYLPFARLLRDWCGAEADDPPDEVLQRMARLLGDLRLDTRILLPPLAALIDIRSDDPRWPALSPTQRRRRIAEAMLTLLRALTTRRKLLLMVEDAHWLDPESAALLDGLVDELATIPLLLLATWRPDYRDTWSRSDAYARIDLQPLNEADCRLLLDARLGVHPGLDPLKAQLTARTQGIPLFVEEMVRSLSETSVVVGEPGRYRLAEAPDTLLVPETVQSVLAARIDRLPARRKEIMQVAAAIGGEFSLPLLAGALRRPSTQLAADLAALKAAEFLIARGSHAGPRFTFRHVLMEEVTYRSLIAPRRQQIHRAIMQAMEELYADRIEQYVEPIAWHAAKGELWQRAIPYLRRAAQKAIERAAHPAAIRFIEQALTAVANLPERGASAIDQEIELRLLLRVSLGALGRYESWMANIDAAERLAEELGDVRRLLLIRVARLHPMNVHGAVTDAIAACREAEKLARARNDTDQIVAATYFLSQALNWRGDFAAGVAVLDALQPVLLALPRDSRCGMTGTARLMCASQLAACHAALGNFREAVANGRAAWRDAGATKRDFDRSVASFGYGIALLKKGDTGRAIDVFEAGLAATEISDIPLLFASIAGPLGLAYLLHGDAGRALELTGRVLARPEVSSYARAWALLYRAQVCLAADPSIDAAALAQEALQRAQQRGYVATEATAHFVLARAMEQADPAARQHLDTAAAMAERWGLRPLGAQCLAAAAVMAAARGRPEEAAHLARQAERRFRALRMPIQPPSMQACVHGATVVTKPDMSPAIL